MSVWVVPLWAGQCCDLWCEQLMDRLWLMPWQDCLPVLVHKLGYLWLLGLLDWALLYLCLSQGVPGACWLPVQGNKVSSAVAVIAFLVEGMSAMSGVSVTAVEFVLVCVVRAFRCTEEAVVVVVVRVVSLTWPSSWTFWNCLHLYFSSLQWDCSDWYVSSC